jgi:hypothetical protein
VPLSIGTEKARGPRRGRSVLAGPVIGLSGVATVRGSGGGEMASVCAACERAVRAVSPCGPPIVCKAPTCPPMPVFGLFVCYRLGRLGLLPEDSSSARFC